jgi:hypothetical protein
MNITEEQKQEADITVEKYLPYAYTTFLENDFWDKEEEIKNATNCAIINRQSVLDALQKAYNIEDIYNATCDYIYYEIQSLTNQIEYLKTKI